MPSGCFEAKTEAVDRRHTTTAATVLPTHTGFDIQKKTAV